MMLQQLKYIFQPLKLSAWKNVYASWILYEAASLLNMNKLPNKHFKLFGVDDSSKLFRQIHALVVKIIYSQLSGQDLGLFQKFVNQFNFEDDSHRAKRIIQSNVDVKLQDHT